MTREIAPCPSDEQYSQAALEKAGLTAEEIANVLEVWSKIREDVLKRIHRDASENFLLLAEPLMIIRFLRAREDDVDKAVAMWRGALIWRRSHVARALTECGKFESYGEDENIWNWRPHATPSEAKSVRGELGARHGHSRRLLKVRADDDAPILIWRMGRFDLAGVARENIQDALAMQQVASLEDALQTCRELSCRHNRLIRARVICDLASLSITSSLKHIGLMKRLMGMAKAFYPEVTASVTIINAPFGFETLWKLVSLLLNDHMRSKVLILGFNFDKAALSAHANISDVSLLPKCLGGNESDSVLAPALPVAPGAGAKLEQDQAPPFLDTDVDYSSHI